VIVNAPPICYSQTTNATNLALATYVDQIQKLADEECSSRYNYIVKLMLQLEHVSKVSNAYILGANAKTWRRGMFVVIQL
jgi:hypothetical protein